MIVYVIIFVVLLLAELAYFKIADKFNIIDKPNERSSHSTIVLRGGGIIFLIGAWIWFIASACGAFGAESLSSPLSALSFMIGLTLVAGVSFVDDIRSLPDSVRLVVQFAAMGMKDSTYFKKTILDPLLAEGIIAMTLPDKPTSPNQMYFLTEKGKRILATERRPVGTVNK